MNAYNLRCFVAVAETLNITKASERLFMSQQNLSNHIARLEDELGTKLFDRKPSLHLTYAGECTLETARRLLREEDQLNRQLEDISDERRSRLRIGATRTRGSLLLIELLPLFHSRYPQVELKTQMGSQRDMVGELENGDIDVMVGMGVMNSVPYYLKKEVIYHTRLCLLSPLNTVKALAPELLQGAEKTGGVTVARPVRDIGGLANADFLLHTDNNVIRDLVNAYFCSHKLQPHILLELNNLEMLHEMSSRGMGVTFSFDYYAREWLGMRHMDAAECCVLPLDEPGLESDLILAYNEQLYLSKSARNFIRMTKEYFSEKNENKDTQKGGAEAVTEAFAKNDAE